MMTTNDTLRSAAIEYAELDYAVFPCAPGSKVPITPRGALDATTDIKQIEAWWDATPDANIGLTTTELLVVDVDGEDNPWPIDPEKALELSNGAVSETPHGGRHHVFRAPEGVGWRNTVGRLAPHVDTRASGGYILVPPSEVGGRPYRWVETLGLDVPRAGLPEPPAWLINALEGDNGSSTLTQVVENRIPDGQRNATLARLAGTMRRVGMSRAEIATALLRVNEDRCEPPIPASAVERVARSISRYEPDAVATAVIENHYAQIVAEPGEDDEAAVDPGPVPESLLTVPGFVQEVIDYTLETAPYPEPVLSFCGALTLQAYLAGRRVRDPGDNRTALYVLGLANSGAGKNHPRQVNQHVLMRAGLTDALGDTFASGEGIEDRMQIQPSALFQTDEIDGLMAAIHRRSDPRHDGIMSVLLKMYTSANALYPMRVKAGKEHAMIDQPSLCIFGTAIPKHYYEALSEAMLTNGFFARMLILESGKRGRGQDPRMQALPKRVVETARWWAAFLPGDAPGNLETWHPVPRTVEVTASARRVLRDLREHADEQYSLAEDRNDSAAMAIWARANEKARRLALVYACSECHESPEITEAGARWAWSLVEHQTLRMLFMAGEHVYSSEFHARCKRLVAVLRAWRERKGNEWMPFWQVNRKLPWTAREHEEARTALQNQMVIEYQQHKTGGLPQRLYRLRPTG